MMGWDDVRALHASGHEIGGHGRKHLELASVSEDRAREEIEGCARDIEACLGERPRLFCYPRGSEAKAVRHFVADAGFEAACTVAPGANPRGQDPFGLRRTEVSGDDSLEDFRLKLAGAFDAWHGLVQAFRKARVP
jgi:peptidoglycan/xylan/chitin deacetylase (PgdA/CDA1 family)